ncbi:MAG: LAGLIDADG family homing endonuclease, partial [Candidatus Subteraquimicrobiales bacterium]|nr:LAGLIDADG family homing endonuclease [Candidatus Subteraquimicrobiales bacterium]
MKEGKIVKVSGPLVVAKGLVDAKMYDLVKVGHQKLMGEIIELRGDRASIQVYEETVGIGPGDPVSNTGEPLSVELGPGLLQTIYDGVQRPLEVIREKAGDFITRGIEVSGLNREKKWAFLPKLSNGDKVVSGDIIGSVQETTIIEHKIMVPPGISGAIKEIKKGEFTVEEVVAVVQSEDGKEHPITMMQRWPVRKPREYKRKLAPAEPLITGQRVVDTFFPITKGGTACVPGPFGSGKCVSGDTPVRLGDGRVIPIKEVFDEYRSKGKITKGESEEYTLLEEPFEVFSYIDGKILKNKVSAVYKGKTNKLIRIKTRTGRTVKVTPVHKLLKMESDLAICEMKAKELKKDDYLVAPRFIDLTESFHGISVADVFGNSRVVDDSIWKKVSQLIGELAKTYGGKKEVAKKLHIGYDVLIGYYLRKNKPTVNFVRELYKLAGVSLPRITCVKGERQSKKVKIPARLDRKLAMFLGLMLGDGSLKNNSVRFYNNNEKMLALFEGLATDLFGLSAKRGVVNTVKCSLIESSILVKLLKYFSYPEYKKSRSCIVPMALQNSPESVVGAFLGAYFACDGYFHIEKGEIEYGTASKAMQTGLSYLLLRLGILSRLSVRTVKGFKQYRLFISSRDEIEKFYNHCILENVPKFQKMREYLCQTRRGYTSLDVVPLGKEHLARIYNLAQRPYTRLKEKGVEIHNYLSGEIMSRKMFRNFAKALNDHSLIAFAANHLEHIFYDKIVDVEEIDEVCDVYDLEVPEGHNFLGGHAPMILHNTVIQHQFARWSNSQII